MKIKFCPSPIGYVDLITIQLLGYGIELHFFPVYTWCWEWSFMSNYLQECTRIETPTMMIKYGKVKPKPNTHA